jgi:hypothetical protein
MTGLIMPAYTFPRDMPLRSDGKHPFEQASFDPSYTQATAPTRGSMIQVVNLGPDLWAMTFQSHILDEEEAHQYQAWLQSLRGGARTFKAWHPMLEFPQAYAEGWGDLEVDSNPFSGSCTLDAIAGTRDELSLVDLPDNFEFSIGDMVSIAMGSSRTLHRVMEAATANGDGEVDITIEPIAPLALEVESPAQEVLLERPYCLAVVDAKSIRGPWQGGRLARVSFNAIQTY